MATSSRVRSPRKATTPKSGVMRRIKRLSIRQWSGIGLIVMLLSLAVWLGVQQGIAATGSSSKLQVTASFYPIYDLARQVGGDAAIVKNIVPPGAEAHDFEPSPRTVAEAHRADLFIYHDEAMEPWVAKFIKDYSGHTVRTIAGIDVHAINEHAEGEEHNHPYDPHVWVDPVYARKMVSNILAGFIAADPSHGQVYRQNAAHLQAQLAQLDQEFRQQLASCSRRTIVTSHAAYHYLADRYNLTVLPIAGLTPTQEPSAAKLAELSRVVREHGITTIFFESQTSPQLAQTLAQETGTKTAILDPIEGINQASAEESYVSIQEKNLANLKAALACR